ncbi:uncharacterized protein [Argopecten irradians]|uniref:uncharacterized protein n=1 Tax=Argopecten irradians TaxID=31199 RepID=UPI00371F88B3
MADEGEQYQMSWYLYHVLDSFIGSEELVNIRRRTIVIDELVRNAEKQRQGIVRNADKKSCHRFKTGSISEGFKMKGSDDDIMFIFKSVVVLCPGQMNSMPSTRNGKSVLWMRPADSRPGYVTLKLACLGQQCPRILAKAIVPVGEQFFVSSEVFRHFIIDGFGKRLNLNFQTHGPAANVFGEHGHQCIDYDCVYSFKCPNWPHEAKEWTIRPRLNGWPDEALRDEIVRSGCYLVPVGDKTSADTFLQWRISFATAERKLVHSLTHVQFLVYGLLKYFLKQISEELNRLLGDTDILSSYIMKTVVFHAVEMTPGTFWQEKHIFFCFMLCLNILITWIKLGRCPNYFIQNNNMFLGKVHGENQRKLLHFLVGLRDMKWGCLSVGTFIKPSIGELVDIYSKGLWPLFLRPPSVTERERDIELFQETSKSGDTQESLQMSITLLVKSKSDSDELLSYTRTSAGLSTVAKNTFRDIHCLRGNKEKYKSLRKCKEMMLPDASVCSSPGPLVLATYYYQTGNYTKALDICENITSSNKIYFYLTEHEQENYEHLYCGRGYTLLKKLQASYMRPIWISKEISDFFPSQLYKLTKLNDPHYIPPLPYAMFLNFLCYHELDDMRRRNAALTDLRAVKYNEKQGGGENWIVHNMLGVCYEMVGDTERAIRAYRESLTVKHILQYQNNARERIELLLSS